MVSFETYVFFCGIIIFGMKDIDNELVGKFIETLRKEKGLTQQDLADKLSVTSQAVSKWEMGKNLPDIATQRMICNAFNITLEELHAGERDLKKRNKSKQMKKENKIFSIILICIIPVMVFFVVYFIINFRALKIYYSNSQITDKANSVRANLLILKLPRKLIIFINNIEPSNYEVKDSDLLELNLYSGKKKLLTTSMIKNDIFEINFIGNFDYKNFRVALFVNTASNEELKFESKFRLVKYTNKNRNDDDYTDKALNYLSSDDIAKKLEKDGYTLTDTKVYEKTEENNGVAIRVKYDLTHEKIEILHIHNNFTEKISIDYQLKMFQTVVFNNNDIDSISEKYVYDLKTKKNTCEIGQCTTLKNTRKLVKKYLIQLQVE